MCRNDRFGERGIVRLHGYGSEHWRVEPDFAVPILPRLGELGVLLEPASVLAKAWDQVDKISRRAFFRRGRALVTGAGPIGLMACLLGVQRGYEVHAVDLAQAGRKRDLVEDLGARYHAGDAADIDVDVDVIIECIGLGSVARSAGQRLASGGIMCLTGIMNLDPTLDLDATSMNRNMVLRNQVLFGTVNAPTALGTSCRSARGRRPQLAQRADHPPGAAHFLGRGARPAAGRHQGRRGVDRMTPDVKVWSATPGLLSEGPRWHEERQELLWVDILGRQMHRGTLSPMAPWNTSRRSRSTGISVRSRRRPGAGTCSLPARGTCLSTTQARSANSPNPRPAAH